MSTTSGEGDSWTRQPTLKFKWDALRLHSQTEKEKFSNYTSEFWHGIQLENCIFFIGKYRHYFSLGAVVMGRRTIPQCYQLKFLIYFNRHCRYLHHSTKKNWLSTTLVLSNEPKVGDDSNPVEELVLADFQVFQDPFIHNKTSADMFQTRRDSSTHVHLYSTPFEISLREV